MPDQPDTKTLITTAIERFIAEVPALAQLKLIAGIELQGRGDLQIYRIELPGPTVAKTIAPDAKITLSLPRAKFNELATRGRVNDWQLAFERGEAKVTGVEQYLKLIAKVVEAQQERDRTRRARTRRSS